jgi:HSP20 family protein
MSGGDVDIFDEMERMVQSMFSEVDSLFDPESRCLKPLHRIEATDDEVVVTFDLPCVEEREDISLVSTEETLSIEATIRKPITLRVGGSFQRRMEFERFSKKIKLPSRVDPNRARARFRNGVLTIWLPLEHEGSSVSIS